MIARFAIVVVAVVAIAWLAAGLHAADLERRANAVGANQPGRFSVPKAEEASRFYERSRRFNPDTRPILLEANLLSFFRAGNDRALALAREVTRREPANVNAWAIVAGMAVRLDPPLAVRARARIRELSPPVPPAR
jgi:hypothetical protein